MPRFRNGMTLLELLVVISIVTLVMLMVTALAGALKSGPPLEQAASGISGLAARVRQVSATQRVHGELVFDYKNDRIVALARQHHVSFAFEDPAGAKDATGSNAILGKYAGGATPVFSRQLGLREGAACELPNSTAAFRISWMQQFEVEGDYEGAGIAFDYFPMGNSTGRVVDFGSVFIVQVAEVRQGACKLSLTCGGEVVNASTFCPAYRWTSIEVAVSKYGVRLYVGGRMDERIPKQPFAVGAGAGSSVNFAGPCRIDNVQFFSLVSSQELEIGPRVQLCPEGVWADKELNAQAEEIFDVDAKPDPKKTGPQGPLDMSLNEEGLPDTRPPAIRHVFFDDSGKLDASIHDGAVTVALVSQGNNGPERMLVTFHPLGAVTTAEVTHFSWEPDPEAEAAKQAAQEAAKKAANEPKKEEKK